MTRWRWFIGLALAVSAAAVAILLLSPALRPLSAPPGPLDRSGRSRPLQTAGHRLTLLHFWATWCVPCRNEIPALARFAHRHAGEGVQIVAVAQDVSFAGVDRFIGSGETHFASLLDPDGRYGASLAVRALPCTIVLDESGATIDRFNGSVDWNDAIVERRILALAGRD